MRPWIQSKISTIYLFVLLLVAILGLHLVEHGKYQAQHPAFNEQLQAASLMQDCLEVLNGERSRLGIPLDRDLDPNATAVIGAHFTEITTSLGNLEAKRTSTNPEFAALLVRYFHDLQLKKGDSIAIGASGSFPGLILAALAASQALELEPLVIYSIGASMYGANLPDFTFVRMLEALNRNDLLPYHLLAVSLGGDGDLAQGAFYDHAEEVFLHIAQSAQVPFIHEETLEASIQKRRELYAQASGDQGIACFVNIGGASPNYGSTSASLHFPNGIVKEPPAAPDHPELGLVFEYARQGVPVIHLLDIRDLALKNGIAIDPVPFPPLGTGAVFQETGYETSVIIATFLVLFILFWRAADITKWIKNWPTLQTAWLGGLFIALALVMPSVVNVENLHILGWFNYSLERLSVGPLLGAGIWLVLMNAVRTVPVYLGALILADLPEEKIACSEMLGHRILCHWLVPLLLVPSIYMLIEAFYGIHYDFGMPAILSISTVIITLRLSQIEAQKSIGRTLFIVFQLVFGFQWLDLVPKLTSLGFGHGEISRDIKIAADLLGASSLFNLFGFVAAGVLILNGLISAKFMVDYQELLRFSRQEKQRILDLERMRSEAVLARNYREMQALVHDLKTPLTTIQGLASVMAEYDESISKGAHFARISKAAERMDAMIQELMRESTRRRISAEEFAKQLAAHLPKEKTQGLVSFGSRQGLPDALINQTRMVRAVVNLVDNAVDSGASQIHVKFSAHGDYIAISVLDNGPGMSEEALERCWNGGYSTKQSTGLGLSFVKQVVEEHLGTLNISSDETGTPCVIHLPSYIGGQIHE